MPNGGEDGVIVGLRDDGALVEFRGKPYSQWTEGEASPMYQIHSSIVRANISNLHADGVETITPWHPEWRSISRLFSEGLSPPL